MRTRPRLLLAVLATAALLLGACGDDDDPPEETTSSTEDTTTSTAAEPDEGEDDMDDMEAAVECIDPAQQAACDSLEVEPKTGLADNGEVRVVIGEGAIDGWLVAQCTADVVDAGTGWQDRCFVPTAGPAPTGGASDVFPLPVTRMIDTRAGGPVDCGSDGCAVTVIDPAAGPVASCPISFG